jgi:phospholipid/cholesterol/gamma-HCH transport system substrate-binding protein
MNRTYLRVAGVAALGLAVLVAVFLIKNPFHRKIVVRAYFANAMSLRAGAPVRLAGVDIGSVESIRARPELKEAPAEVVMLLAPSYELNIPSDSTASLETAGVLGQTYVDIDATHASGAPIASDAILKTVVTPQLTSQEMLEKFSEILSRKCNCDSDKENGSTHPTATKGVSKSAHQQH